MFLIEANLVKVQSERAIEKEQMEKERKAREEEERKRKEEEKIKAELAERNDDEKQNGDTEEKVVIYWSFRLGCLQTQMNMVIT